MPGRTFGGRQAALDKGWEPQWGSLSSSVWLRLEEPRGEGKEGGFPQIMLMMSRQHEPHAASSSPPREERVFMNVPLVSMKGDVHGPSYPIVSFTWRSVSIVQGSHGQCPPIWVGWCYRFVTSSCDRPSLGDRPPSVHLVGAALQSFSHSEILSDHASSRRMLGEVADEI